MEKAAVTGGGKLRPEELVLLPKYRANQKRRPLVDTNGLASKCLARFRASSALPLGAFVQDIMYTTLCNVSAYYLCDLGYILSMPASSSVK